MDLLLLRSFLAVADHRTITRASRALGLTQPALTRRLQLLEEDVGAPLFERSRRGMALTDAGRLVADEARLLVDRYTAMQEQVRARLTLEKGVVRIGGGATAVSFLVPQAIARFQKAHPGVRFHVREAGSREVEADVLDERIELGIVTLPLHSKEFDVVPLRRDRIVLVAAPDHPLARRRRVDVKDLAGGDRAIGGTTANFGSVGRQVSNVVTFAHCAVSQAVTHHQDALPPESGKNSFRHHNAASAGFFAASILSLKTPNGNSLLITSSIHLQAATGDSFQLVGQGDRISTSENPNPSI